MFYSSEKAGVALVEELDNCGVVEDISGDLDETALSGACGESHAGVEDVLLDVTGQEGCGPG